MLVRNLNHDHRFVSVGPWQGLEAIDRRRSLPGWAERVAKLRELVGCINSGASSNDTNCSGIEFVYPTGRHAEEFARGIGRFASAGGQRRDLEVICERPQWAGMSLSVLARILG
jgi:hypothetical protein